MAGGIDILMPGGIAEGMMRDDGRDGRLAQRWVRRTVGSWRDDCQNACEDGCEDGCPEAQCTSTVNKGVGGMDGLRGWTVGWTLGWTLGWHSGGLVEWLPEWMSGRECQEHSGSQLAKWMGWEDGWVGLEVGLAMRLAAAVCYMKINV
jgi:hypothetical protein